MRNLFSTRVKVILVVAALLTAGLAILSGITKLGHKFSTGEMPPPWEPESYRITLYFSDGNQKIYRYHPLRYLYIQQQGWKRINDDRSADFLALLKQLPEE